MTGPKKHGDADKNEPAFRGLVKLVSIKSSIKSFLSNHQPQRRRRRCWLGCQCTWVVDAFVSVSIALTPAGFTNDSA
jgi:hypothetical protein